MNFCPGDVFLTLFPPHCLRLTTHFVHSQGFHDFAFLEYFLLECVIMIIKIKNKKKIYLLLNSEFQSVVLTPLLLISPRYQEDFYSHFRDEPFYSLSWLPCKIQDIRSQD